MPTALSRIAWVPLAMLCTVVACKGGSTGDPPANEKINTEARKRIDAIREGMSRGADTTVPCAGTKMYANALEADKSVKSKALVAEIRTLCEHDAPLAYARAALAKMKPPVSATDCAAVTNALNDIPADQRNAPDVRDVSTRHASFCAPK